MPGVQTAGGEPPGARPSHLSRTEHASALGARTIHDAVVECRSKARHAAYLGAAGAVRSNGQVMALPNSSAGVQSAD